MKSEFQYFPFPLLTAMMRVEKMENEVKNVMLKLESDMKNTKTSSKSAQHCICGWTLGWIYPVL